MTRWRAASLWCLASLAAVAVACGAGPEPAERPAARADAPAADSVEPAGDGAAPAAPAAAAAHRRIVFLGDSLTAGLGLPVDESYPAILERRLAERRQGWTVANAGVSGDTSAGGLRRLDWALEGGAAIVVVALGGNDGLRGLPVADLEKNLDAIITRAKAAGADVVLAGMEAPPNTGPDYTARFRAVYPTLAARHRVPLIPFLLEGVAGDEAFNQADGIHPNRDGAQRVADVVWRVLEPVVAAREKAATE